MGTAEKKWSWKGFLFSLFLVVILPNLFFWLVSGYLGLGRPYINVDFAVVMLFFLLGQRLVGAFLLALAFFFDILALLGQIIPVLRFSDVFYVMSFWSMAPTIYKLATFVCLGFLFFCFWGFSSKKNQHRKLEMLVVINAVVFGYFYMANFSYAANNGIWRVKQENLIDSQTVFGFASRETGFVEGFSLEGDLFGSKKVAGATAEWFSSPDLVGEKVLLVVSESWGVVDEEIQSEVLSAIVKNPRIENLEKGELGFRGVTLKGEMRELCQLIPNHFNFEDSAQEFTSCLPHMLREKGYKTHAFHGAAGLMYDRVKWYPYAGFEKMTFFESQSWPRRCYSFPGVCDSDMASNVKAALKAEGKVFAYWLTLNSHYMYDERDIHNDVFDCNAADVPVESQTCRNLKLHAQFFDSLSRMVMDDDLANMKVIVVGDHPPPITNEKELSEFFDQGRVPWIAFSVKDRNG